MNLSADYDKILTESLKDELIWFEEEFELLYSNKESYTDEEITLANQMIDNITQKIYALKNSFLNKILTELLEKIKKKYKEIF